jgi:hypothetical protein
MGNGITQLHQMVVDLHTKTQMLEEEKPQWIQQKQKGIFHSSGKEVGHN